MEKRKTKTSVDMTPLLKRCSNIKHEQDDLMQFWSVRNLDGFRCIVEKRRLDLNHIYTEHNQMTLLELTATEPGCEEFVQTLLTNGAQVNTTNPISGRAPIHFSAETANVGALSLLLQYGGDINIQDYDGDTPLHLLIKKWEQSQPSYEEALHILLNRNDLAINIPNKSGHTPISLAATMGEAEVVAELLRLGSALDLDTFRSVDENKTSREIILKNFPGLEEELPGSWQPDSLRGILDFKFRLFYFLHTSQEIRFCQVFREAMNVKSENQALLTSVDDQRYTYLQHAAVKGFTKVARMLLRYGADVNLAQPGTERPALLSSRNGNNEILAVLLATKQIDLSPDANGETLLHTTVKARGRSFGHYETLRRLVQHEGIDINAKDVKGRTALHFAVTYADEKSIFLLLDHGAKLDATNNFGETPLRQLSSSTLRKYLDKKITTNNEPPKQCDFAMMFDYKFAFPERSGDHINGVSTELLSHISKLPELRQLLAHPIYSTVILFKWQRIRMYFYLDLFVYTLFCILLTSYLFFGPQIESSSCATFNDTNTVEPLHNICNESNHYVLAAEIFLLLFLAVLAISELYQCLSAPANYFKSVENWLQIGVAIFSAVSLILGCPQDPHKFAHCKDISAYAIFFTWFEFFFVIGKHPKLTFYIDMFRTASSFLLIFLAVHTSLVLAFVFSFYILFHDTDGPFTSIPKSFFKTVVMITGEYDVGEIPLDSSPITSHLLFVCFLFLVAIVLFNLLIGLAVSATRPIEDDAFLYRCIAQVPIISFFENLFFNDSHYLKVVLTKILKWKRRKDSSTRIYPVLYVFPNQKNRLEIRFTPEDSSDQDVRIFIRHHLLSKIVEDAQYILINKQDSQTTVCDQFGELKIQLEATKSALEEELRTIKTALVEIMDKFEGHDETDSEAYNSKRKRAKADLILKKLRSYGLKQLSKSSSQDRDSVK